MSGRAAPPPGRLSHQVAAVLRGRKAELQVTDQQIGDAIGVSQEQVSRFLKPTKVMMIEQTEALCEYLGLDFTATLRGERKLVEAQPSGADPPTDLRALIEWLIAHPDRDEELITRLSDAQTRTGVTGRRWAELQETIRAVRYEELAAALAALPPSVEPGDQRIG